ncbi:MAG: Maf-like protein [Bacteroidales bacterium]|nr:Maf-like protein [Bacteroidales bacterium]MCI7379325.1 Maf-like protein [Bacteroidales bacterium]
MLDNLKNYDIILASNSPRRKELLQRLGLPFKVRTLFGVDESFPENLRGEDIALYIARKKAEAYKSSMSSNELLITADTIVCLDGVVMGKPYGAENAKTILRQLSGRVHQVITGVTVLTQVKRESFAVTSHVKFANVTEDEIDYYVDNYLPFDKAGAYGIQEWFGLVAVEELRGSYFNVMGLPVQRLYTVLKQF